MDVPLFEWGSLACLAKLGCSLTKELSSGPLIHVLLCRGELYKVLGVVHTRSAM